MEIPMAARILLAEDNKMNPNCHALPARKVGLSSRARPCDRDEAIALGMDAYLTKLGEV